MRLHFQERPWDLYIVVAYAALVATTLFAVRSGNIATIFLILFTPGYVLVAALFPSRKHIDWIERLLLSFGLSIVVGPLLVLALNFTPFGIRPFSVVATMALFSFVVGFAAWRRRVLLPVSDRVSATLDIPHLAWKDFGSVDKTLTPVLAACIVLALGFLVYTIATPRPEPHFTEFYVIGQQNNASDYSRRLNVSQPDTLLLGIANHESASMNYTIRVELVGVRVVYNGLVGANETVELNRTTLSWLNVTLLDGQNWTQPYTFRINATGLWQVQFFLFKTNDFSLVYRELYLPITVD